jgi:hypothetical protein
MESAGCGAGAAQAETARVKRLQPYTPVHPEIKAEHADQAGMKERFDRHRP